MASSISLIVISSKSSTQPSSDASSNDVLQLHVREMKAMVNVAVLVSTKKEELNIEKEVKAHAPYLPNTISRDGWGKYRLGGSP